MTEPGSSRPPSRPALSVGRAALLVVVVIVGLPVWLAWALAVALLSMARPFVTVPIGLATVAAFCLALYFFAQGDTASALRAAITGGACGAAFLAFTALGDRIGPSGPVWPLPPWWWFS